MKRILTWLNRGIVLPMLALLLLLLWLLFTQPGLRLSLYLTEKALPQLQVEAAEGAWLTGITLQRLNYRDQQFELTLERLNLRLQKRCLLQFRLCLPELQLSGLTLNQLQAFAQTDSTDNNPASAVTAAGLGIAFPIPIRIDRLILDDIALNLAEQQLSWQHFSIGINAWGNRLQLNQGNWQGLKLTLPQRPDSAPVSAYSPPVLPPIQLPISIFLDAFQLSDATLQQGEQQQQLALLKLSAQLTPQQIRLLDFTAQHALFRAEGSANVQLSTHFPLSARLELELSDTALAGQRLQAQLSGDLAHLQLQLNATGPVTLQAEAEAALLSADLPLQLQARAGALGWPLSTPEYQLSDSQLLISGSLSDLRVQLSSALSGNGLPDSQLAMDAHWLHWQQQARISELTIKTLQGEIQAQGELALAPIPSWQVKLALSNIAPEQYWPDFPGRLNGEWNWLVNINLSEA